SRAAVWLSAAAACLAVVLLCAPEAAAAHPLRHHPAAARHLRHRPSAHTSTHRLRQEAPTRQIACTVLGCQPIPAACRPVPGRTPGGIPTGFDVIVCPPGIWPLR
ncbi:MAG TPA: hypothetical protein VMB71_06270, partial [Acetobacteraceae bacterium]|nr:hypothetical protein [Acetobacteraceae bacterium]